jgi:hypothetical protein
MLIRNFVRGKEEFADWEVEEIGLYSITRKLLEEIWNKMAEVEYKDKNI